MYKTTHKQKVGWHFKSVLLSLLLLFSGTVIFGQERSISGTIIDNTGTPLPGVNVIVKGTTNGTVSDIDGKFAIKADAAATLQFKYVGYVAQEVTVGDQNTIGITLKEDIKELNEVVVIGYGVQKKSDLTGAVATVKAEEINKIAVTSVTSALQGKAAGVQVSENNGAPGSGVTLRIRGISSITEGSKPMWIIDGVPGDPKSVNNNDIQSIEILKDASSAAIYGAAGANGVVIITTKSGSGKNKVDLNVDYYHGFQTVPNRLNIANSQEYGNMFLEYQTLFAKGKNLTKLIFPNYKTDPTYDYQDMIFRIAAMDNVSVSVSGGTEKFNSYLSMGYIKQEGILKSTDYQKFNFRLKSEYNPLKWLKLGENATFTYDKADGFEEWEYKNEYTSPLTAAVQVLPNHNPYDSTGNWNPREFGNSDGPMPSIDLMNKERKTYSGSVTFNGIIEPIKGLTYESKVTLGLYLNNNRTFNPTYYYGSGLGQFNTISKIYRFMEQGSNYQLQNILSYNTTILNNFNIGIVAGHEVGSSEMMNMEATRRNLYTEDPEMWYFNASQNDTTLAQLPKGTGNKSSGYSYLGRLNLDYKGKYLFQANFRRDYSSRFGPNKRVGNFPGFSVGWKFTEEEFVKTALPFITFGKLRYALGRAGNNAVRDYAYYATVSSVNGYKYSLNNTPTLSSGAAPDVLPNLSIHWEDVETINYGIDLGLFDNKLSVTVDRFERHNIGMLIRTQIPTYAGWTVRDPSQESANVKPEPIENVGQITNKGWEFTIGWKDNIGKLSYSFDANYSYVTNEATKLGEVDTIRYSGNFMSMSNFCRTVQGAGISEFYGFQVEKIFQSSDAGILPGGKVGITNQPYYIKDNGDTSYAQISAQPGDFKFKDVNGDGKITDKDMVKIGNPNPKHLFGLNINLEYGIFDLTMFWQGTYGNDIFNFAKYYGFNQSGLYNWNADYVNNHYRENDVVAKDASGNVIETFAKNTSAKYPRLDPQNKNGNFDRVSDFYVEDGSYVRLKNIQLGMKLPSTLSKKLGIGELRVYVGAKNLLTFTKYSGMDPEVAQDDVLASGLDKSSYPQARIYLVGASLKF